MKKKLLSILFFSLLLSFNVSAQSEKCGTMKAWNKLKAQDPNAQLRKNQLESFTKNFVAEHLQEFQKNNSGANNSRGLGSVITIPVVVHVIHAGEPLDSGSNISDAAIFSQMDVLNRDFRLLNADSVTPTHPFYSLTADAKIQFCLAKQDPSGNATTGIVRINSGKVYFTDAEVGNNDVKKSATGGDNNWAPTKYLNIWTYKTEPTSKALGEARFPSDLASKPEEDGVTCNYAAFGTMGPDLQSDNALGRTMTHEIGHWLNLSHIWGDGDVSNCGDDFVADTPPADSANYGCKTFPWKVGAACTSDPNGQMYMDYMDYSDDGCLVAFTAGQAARMTAALNGDRSALLTSNGCQTPTAIARISDENIGIEVYPNPSTGNFYIRIKNAYKADYIQLILKNEIGMELQNLKINQIDNYKLNLSNLASGIYFLETIANDKRATQKLILTK